MIVSGSLCALSGCADNSAKGTIELGKEVYEYKLAKHENPGAKPAFYHNYWQAEVKSDSGDIILRDIEPFGDMDFIGFRKSERRDYVLDKNLEYFKQFQSPTRYADLLEHDMGYYRQLYLSILKDAAKKE